MSYFATSVAKISGSTQVKLVSINAKVRPIKSMSLANPTDNYYIIKNVVIPFAATLVLDEELVNYNTNVYNLYIKLSAGDSAVDVIIKNN